MNEINEYIYSEWKSKLNSIKISSETLESRKQHERKPDMIYKIKFDFVIRNSKNDIVCTGLYIADNDVKSLEKLENKLSYDSEYPIFYLNEKGLINFIHKGRLRYEISNQANRNSISNIEFISILKQNDSTLLTDLDDKDEEIKKLENTIKELEVKVNELQGKILWEQEYYSKEILTKNKLIETFKKNEETEMINEFNNCNFQNELINEVSNAFKLERKSNLSGNRYESGGQLYYTETSAKNDSAKYFLTYSLRKWLLKIDLYDYYLNGPCDVPGDIFSHSMYFEFNEQDLKYYQIKFNEDESNVSWLEYSLLSDKIKRKDL
jgi:hypothetical protein